MNDMHPAEVVRRGWELYERHIRPEVESAHEGRALVLDVESGRYVLADDDLEAFDRARDQIPAGVYYLVRVGQRTAHRIGRGAPRQVRGSVSASAREAVIGVRVAGVEGHADVEVDAVIDTGSRGTSHCLPTSLQPCRSHNVAS